MRRLLPVIQLLLLLASALRAEVRQVARIDFIPLVDLPRTISLQRMLRVASGYNLAVLADVDEERGTLSFFHVIQCDEDLATLTGLIQDDTNAPAQELRPARPDASRLCFIRFEKGTTRTARVWIYWGHYFPEYDAVGYSTERRTPFMHPESADTLLVHLRPRFCGYSLTILDQLLGGKWSDEPYFPQDQVYFGLRIYPVDPCYTRQEYDRHSNVDIDYVIPMPPMPIGGEASIMKNLHYPCAAFEAGIDGKALIFFVVCRDGRVTNPQIMAETPKDQGFGEAAVAALSACRYSLRLELPLAESMTQVVKFNHTEFDANGRWIGQQSGASSH